MNTIIKCIQLFDETRFLGLVFDQLLHFQVHVDSLNTYQKNLVPAYLQRKDHAYRILIMPKLY